MRLYHTQTANAIVLTLGIIVLVFSMVGLATTRLKSMSEMTNYDTGIQQATSAAEAVTAFRETTLVELAASNNLGLLTKNPETLDPNDPWEGMEWFANCIVRWRVEPVRIANEDGRFITNPFLFGVNTEMQDDPDYLENHEYYHYRISSEAHYLSNPNLVNGTTLAALEAANELPWQNPRNKVATVRATRIVQMRLNSLFKYALFHAKEGPYGDIEIGPGYDQNITGRVHSNGGIYIAGGGIRYNPRGWGAAVIGDPAEKVDMVGINGVYRLRKDSLLMAHRDAGNSNLYVPIGDASWGDKVWYGDGNQDPLPIDTTYPVDLSSGLNDTQANPNHRLNGVSLTYRNDSRSKDEMKNAFGAFLRDSFNSGATVVKTLSNIPQLGGRPFEAQRLFAEGTQVWTTNPGNPSDISSWTILPNDSFRPADFYVDPDGLDGDSNNDFDFTETAGVNSVAVVQYAKRLYHRAAPRNRKVAGTSYAPGNPLIAVDVDEDGDGTLDNAGVAYDASEWFVDAAGLRQWYQRTSPTVGKYMVNGSDSSPAALAVVDIFDSEDLWDGNPNPLGPGNALSANRVSPGDAGFRYNGPSTLDSDGDSFGDNEVLGTYIDWAMNSKDDADNAGKYGLVIRERRYQKIPDNGSTDDWSIKPDRPTPVGGALTVTLHRGGGARGADWTVADAIKFVEVNTGEEIIIDTEDPGYSEYPNGPSDWGDIGQPNYYGTSKSRRTKTAGAYARWTVRLPPGEYRLDTYFSTHGSARDETAYYIVNGVQGGPFTSPPISMQNPGNGADPHGGEGFYDFQGQNFIPEDGGFFGYANYMKSQYVVYFGQHDVTDIFFQYDIAAANDDTGFVAYERDILDRREAVFMQYQFWNQDPAFSSTYWRDYRVSVLTFNMRKTLDFLMDTDYADVNPGYTGSDKLKDHFNGMIYAHRTRRSDDYTPWDSTRWHPECYGIWNRSNFVNYEMPPSGHRPNVDAPSTVWPAKGFDWRTGSGPAMTFHSSIRLTNAEDLDYGVYYVADQGTPEVSDDYSTKKGLTFISPNMTYVWGDYNTVKYSDSNSGDGLGVRSEMGDATYADANYKNVPCAIFADYINILSNDWLDEDQLYNQRTPVNDDTWMITSVITNNIPSHVDGNNRIHSSEGSHNLIRYNESWGSRRTFHLKGSNVVMNTRRYSRSHIAYKYEAPNLNNDVYDPPNRDFVMNSDLFTKPGQPPFTPFGVTVTRTVSTIEDLNQ